MPRRKKEEEFIDSYEYKRKSSQIEESLVQNLVALQKAHVTLIEKFDHLTEQINSLLVLFEVAARNFAENPESQINERDREFLEKIDKLLDQNKTIAKGLTLMEEKIRDKLYGHHEQQLEENKKESYPENNIKRDLMI